MTLVFKKPFSVRPIVWVGLLFAVIGVSCGGGGGSAPPPPTDQDAQGLYTNNGAGSGTFKNMDASGADVVEALADIKGMVSGTLPNQKFIFFDLGSNVLYKGKIQTIKLKAFTGTATVYHDGVMVDNKVKVSGTITTDSSIDMTLAASGNFKGGRIKGLFSTAYNNPATNSRIEANLVQNWESSTVGSVKTAIAGMTLSGFKANIDGTYQLGLFSAIAVGSFFPDCDISGILISGNSKNIYTMNKEVMTDGGISPATICKDATRSMTLTPNYSGFASVITTNASGQGTTLWYAITNGTDSVFFIATRNL